MSKPYSVLCASLVRKPNLFIWKCLQDILYIAIIAVKECYGKVIGLENWKMIVIRKLYLTVNTDI